MKDRGFTLIELLIVVVIIGILATIAIPKFANTKQKAYIAAMKSDLRNLVTAEESYFADQVSYTTSTTAVNFTPSSGVTLTIGVATGTGWNATSSHNALPAGKTCGIFVGSAAAPVAGGNEGEPKCT